MWSIKCGSCNHEDNADRFITGQPNRHACPACGIVWRIEQHGRAVFTESGFVIPPKKVCVVEPQMMLVAA